MPGEKTGLQVTPVTCNSVVPQKLANPKVKLTTGKGSALGIGFYPTFSYDASSGGETAPAETLSETKIRVSFDPQKLKIPSVTWRTTKFLGAPLPPCFRIDIVPSKLEGTIDLASGQIELRLVAEFHFKALGVYKAPPMAVDTLLTTEEVNSPHHHRKGSRLNDKGQAVLVGVGDVEKTGHWPLDCFLRLPTDVLGLMTCNFQWEAEIATAIETT